MTEWSCIMLLLANYYMHAVVCLSVTTSTSADACSNFHIEQDAVWSPILSFDTQRYYYIIIEPPSYLQINYPYRVYSDWFQYYFICHAIINLMHKDNYCFIVHKTCTCTCIRNNIYTVYIYRDFQEIFKGGGKIYWNLNCLAIGDVICTTVVQHTWRNKLTKGIHCLKMSSSIWTLHPMNGQQCSPLTKQTVVHSVDA